MRRPHAGTLLLACAALAARAAAGEIELGGEGYAFTLRDTGYSSLGGGVVDSERPSFSLPEPLRLEALGWRARAGLTFHDGAERVSVVVQRLRDDVHLTLGTRIGGFTLDQTEDDRAAITTVDARYEHRVVSDGRFELRVQGGYRFARLTQARVLSGVCPACRELLDARVAQATADSRLTGHGLRAGAGTDVRLAGPLHLEAEAGLALLAASDRGVSRYLNLAVTDTRRHPSLATWDLSARLRAEWKGVSLGAGYRFERWDRVTPLVLGSSNLGFDGFTFGLGWRLGL